MLKALTSICATLIATAALGADEAAAPLAEAKLAANTATASTGGKGTKSTQPKPAAEAKTLSGMSILGNQEAPKALVIVPWKSSQLGEPQGISKQLDDGRQPVDKEVFMRELSYYEIRTGSK